MITRQIAKLALVVTCALSLPSAAVAEEGKPAEKGGKDGKGKVDEPEFPRPSETVYEARTFSKAETQRLCGKYNNEVIAYYSEMWKVEGCERRPITDSKTVYEYLRSGKKVINVPEDVVAAIPEGDPMDWAVSVATARNCNKLEGQYVSFSSVDVYFVERCKKRLFPDWTTYIKHRERRNDRKGEILSLSWVEFDQLAAGDPIPSVIDDIFAKMLRGDIEVDVIPVDEACQGVDGQLVSYYSRLYRIERCKKREVMDPEFYIKRHGLQATRLTELKSEQWISLPDGQPIESGAPRYEPKKDKK